jgi:hypothetical protein
MKTWDVIRGILFWSLMILLSFALRSLKPEFSFFPLAGVVVLFVVVFTYDRILKRKRLQQGPK